MALPCAHGSTAEPCLARYQPARPQATLHRCRTSLNCGPCTCSRYQIEARHTPRPTLPAECICVSVFYRLPLAIVVPFGRNGSTLGGAAVVDTGRCFVCSRLIRAKVLRKSVSMLLV